jgi:N-methylhydantoinase A
MADLLRKETVEKGYDPRQFTLYSYGGAGPAFAATYGGDLDVEEVVVPKAAAVFSALGIAFADTQRTYSRTHTLSLSEANADTIGDVFKGLEERAIADIESTTDSVDEFGFTYTVDLRYEGQMNELSITTDRDPDPQTVRESFDHTYDQRYGAGASLESASVEAVTFRLRSVKPGATLPLEEQEFGGTDSTDAHRGTRTMRFPDDGIAEGKIYEGMALSPGNSLQGPAVIERPRTTIVVPPEFEARVDGLENIRISW